MTSRNPILSSLTEEDRFFFQSRRYGLGFLWIMRLPSGKVLLGDPKRDPLAIIEVNPEVGAILDEFKKNSDHRVYKVEKARERHLERAQKRTAEDTNLEDIEIDL